jgi:N-acetyl-alpha-D-glucosaminyl L-malate synthase BshA
VSEYLKRETVEKFAISPDAIRAIPNFVDPERYLRSAYPCHRSKFALEGEKIVTHISNFRAVKRVHDVVRIFARIADRIPARLLLVGDGPERVRAQNVAAEEGVTGRVIFLGKQNSVAELLSCTDLFLLPSESEAFGLVALEAMACGVPVVATNVGGIPEVLPPPPAGQTADVGDVDRMAELGLAVVEDATIWAEASKTARAAAERFSADRIVPQYENYYAEVLDR